MGGISEKLQDFILPAGAIDPDALPEPPKLLRRDPFAPAPLPDAEEAAANIAAIAEGLRPQIERQKAEAEKASKTAPFRAWLQELSEMLQAHATTGEGNQGRTEIEFALYRVEKNSGTENAQLLEKFVRNPQEAMDEGMPDLEGFTLDVAKKTGVFGSYRWNIRAWIDGENVKNTSMRLSVAEPPGHVASTAPPSKPPEERKDPMQEVNNALTLIRSMREAFGGGGNGGSDREMGILMGRMESAEAHRREMRELEDRWAAKQETAQEQAYKQGRTEGEQAARQEWERKVWDLERQIELNKLQSGQTDVVDKIVGIMGGQEATQKIVGMAVSALTGPSPIPRPAPPNARSVRPAPPARVPQPAPAPLPVATPTLASSAQAPAPEIPPELLAEATGLIAQAADLLRAAPEAAQPDIAALIQGMDNLTTAGRRVTGVQAAQFWAEVSAPRFPDAGGARLSWLELAAKITTPKPQEEEDMSIAELKALLVARLAEGKTTAEILAELDDLVDPDVIEEWRGFLEHLPIAGALGWLGVPSELHTQGRDLLEAFKAGGKAAA